VPDLAISLRPWKISVDLRKDSLISDSALITCNGGGWFTPYCPCLFLTCEMVHSKLFKTCKGRGFSHVAFQSILSRRINSRVTPCLLSGVVSISSNENSNETNEKAYLVILYNLARIQYFIESSAPIQRSLGLSCESIFIQFNESIF